MNKLLNVLTSLMAVCAIAVSGTIVRREFVLPNGDGIVASLKPIKVNTWKQVASEGQQYGAQNAPIVITQFSDFQCPYCKRLHEVLAKVEEAYPNRLSLVYRHFPLARIHPHARAAAYAAECAARKGSFRKFQDVLFAHQDSIGKIPWTVFALRSGIAGADTGRIESCMRESSIIARITADSAAGVKLGVRGTPTVLINNWLMPGTPTFEQIDSVIRSLLPRPR